MFEAEKDRDAEINRLAEIGQDYGIANACVPIPTIPTSMVRTEVGRALRVLQEARLDREAYRRGLAEAIGETFDIEFWRVLSLVNAFDESFEKAAANKKPPALGDTEG